MENQAVKPTVSAGDLQGGCQNEPELGTEDTHQNDPTVDKRSSGNPSHKKPIRTMQSQIEARPKPEDPALRTNAPLPDHGQPPKLILQEDGGVDLPSLMSMQKAFGTSDQGLTEKLLLEAVGTIPDLKSLNVNQINPVIAAIHAIAPRDALEGMLAVQMVSVHNVAMERLRRSIGADSLGEDSSINEATKLLKLFTTLMEALDRHRGKGDSKMVVKHLHVEKGAQAIVGPVSHPSPGNAAEDSHGKLQ